MLKSTQLINASIRWTCFTIQQLPSTTLRYLFYFSFLQPFDSVDYVTEEHPGNASNDRLTAFDPGQPG